MHWAVKAAVVGASISAMTAMAHADGRIRVTDASGVYNGTDGSGGAFVVERLVSFHANQQNAGYVGQRFGEQGLGATHFHTFCVEVGEFISFGGTYYAEVSKSAKAGGSGDADPSGTDSGTTTASEDYLSYVTAKIFREFRDNGTFGGAITGGLDSAETTAIQQAIWYSEGEIGSVSGTALAVYNWANANHGNSLWNVRVLRLWDSFNSTTGEYSGNRQDLLTLIPLPTAGGLACAGFLMLGVRVRSRTT